MDAEILWRFVGDHYELARGTQRRLVSSELWWSTLAGAKPTQVELAQLWKVASQDRDRDTAEADLATALEAQAELERYVKELHKELNELLEAQKLDHGSNQHLIAHQKALLDAANIQLDHQRRDTRRKYN